jgi:hypothetical protein
MRKISKAVECRQDLSLLPDQIERQQRHIDAMRPLDPSGVDDIWIRSLHLIQDDGEIGVGLVTSRGPRLPSFWAKPGRVEGPRAPPPTNFFRDDSAIKGAALVSTAIHAHALASAFV